MNKDDIKKALAYCASDSIDDCKACPYADNGPFACSISMYKDAHTLITEQENEIEYRKKQYDNQVSENTRLHIEYDKAIERLKAQQQEINALQEENRRLDEYVSCALSAQEFDEEIKQAKIDVLNELKEKCKFDGHTVAVYKNDIEEMIKEVKNER